MNKKKIAAFLLALASTSSYAGAMGTVVVPDRLLLIEAGGSYTHAFYEDQAVFPESINTTTPNGHGISLDRFYPDDFFGGYFGASIYFPQGWLMNSRLDIFSEKTKHNAQAETSIKIAPVKLSFTLDRVWGNMNDLSYGAGAGAVVEAVNDGDFVVALDPTHPASESLQGRARIDPLIEAFAMYRFANNFGIKFNAAYQIAAHSKFSDGDLNLNLGVNFACPI